LAGDPCNDGPEDLANRFSRSFLGAQELLTVHLGLELGLYAALADAGPSTASEVAMRAGCDERYVLEWLEQQAVSAIIAVDDIEADAGHRHFSLPPDSRAALLEEGALAHVGPFASIIAALARGVPAVVAAFRSGSGVPSSCYGDGLGQHMAALNRPLFTHLLTQRWLPGLPEVDARLRAAPPAQVADIGCGAGWAAISLARAFPGITIDGMDADPQSVAEARRNAREAGVADRVRFATTDAAQLEGEGQYELVLCLESLHDMGRPADVLARIRSLLADEGSVLVAEEAVDDRFVAPGDARERAAYCWSVLHCLPVARAGTATDPTGAVLRPSTLSRLAREAGFGRVEVVAIDDPVFRFYRLRR
jgi:2-polyprenyl-3-methyl-5-hydroxy-6-metoxy-1,4-benzoquinol methylase